MPAKLVKVFNRRRAKGCFASDPVLCRLSEIFGQVADTFNIGDQVLELETANLLAVTEILLAQPVDKVFQGIRDRVNKLVLLLEYPLSSVHIVVDQCHAAVFDHFGGHLAHADQLSV